MRLPWSWSWVSALTLLACSSSPEPREDVVDASVEPDAITIAPEICDNAVEDDGDGWIDCDDSECELDARCQPEMMCNDDVDQDGDGAADCDDPDCAGSVHCLPEAQCGDGVDQDGDGAMDCADPDCATFCLAGCGASDTVVSLIGGSLPQPLTTTAPVTVNFPVTAEGWITGAAVRFSVTHTFDGDLDISLRSPGGPAVDLTSDNGGGGDHYTDTVLADGAATVITDGAAPFTGAYRPEQAFSTIAGAPAHGVWRIAFSDDASGDDGSVTAADLYLCVCDGTAGCERGLACLDGEDNDGDGLVDCADLDDCGDFAQCVPETACADDVDNDLDGALDCVDDDCTGIGTCEHPEATCDDGVDNDEDMLTDCADSNCFASTICAIEDDCADGADDDADGHADCADPGCVGHDGCAAGPEVSCEDAIDNDGDGALDCADTDCAGALACAVSCPPGLLRRSYVSTDVPTAIVDNGQVEMTIAVADPGLVLRTAVQVDIAHTYDGDLDLYLVAPGGTRELSTDNGSGEDNYTRTVFLDTAATAITAGAAPFTGAFRPEQPLAPLNGHPLAGDWTLRVGDDATGDSGTVTGYQLVVCACDPASGDCELGPACRNDVDDDGDGLVDCAEQSCAEDVTCIPEAVCNDQIDQDLDGAVDCADSDCNGLDGCEHAVEITCGDAADNDADGLVDCADSDCGGAPACATQPEADCGDGVDDDGDGNVDCADLGCDGVDQCEHGAEVSCDDGFDNDGDAALDCADAQCSDLLICAIPACPAGTHKVLSTATGLPAAIPDGAPDGPLVATITRDAGLVAAAAVQVSVTHPFDQDLDLFLAAPGGARELSTDNGSGGDHYTGTTFVDGAATAITAGSAPFTGRYRPEQALSALAGTPSGGDWTLRVADDGTGDTGTLDAYALLTCECTAGADGCEFGAACHDGADNDGDSLADCADPACATVPFCAQPVAEHVCNDGLDDDADGLIDCADSTCQWLCTAIPSCPADHALLSYAAYELPRAIPTTAATLETQAIVPRAGAVVTAAVRFDAAHSFDADLDLTITSPAGTALDVTSDNGSSDDHYTATVFVDVATIAITAGTAPFTGLFRPEQAFSAWTGQPVQGAWSVRLDDDAGGDGGTWNDLQLGFCVAPTP